MALTDIFKNGLTFAISQNGGTLTFKDNEYDCYAGSPTESHDLEMEGFYLDVDLRVHIKIEDFTSGLPDKMDLVTYNGTEYRVASVVRGSHGETMSLMLVDKSK